MSFFGGGTDYPDWYLKEGGAVLSTTIDKYCYLNCRYLPPFFPVKHRVVWSHIETVSTISEILHPAVREGLRYLGFDDSKGLEIHHQGDLPARSGIGSSSSFSVGLINALTALRGQTISKHELALKAIELEQGWLREPVGSQDQVAAAHGGLNLIHFRPSGDIEVEPVACDAARVERLQSSLLLFYLGMSRLGSETSSKLIENLPRQQKNLRAMRGMVDEAESILKSSRPLDDFGALLHENWLCKRELAPDLTNATVNSAYETAMGHGALGGKLLGAGGTGFMLFYVPQERQSEVKEALARYMHVPFMFEDDGSVVVYSSPEDSAGPW